MGYSGMATCSVKLGNFAYNVSYRDSRTTFYEEIDVAGAGRGSTGQGIGLNSEETTFQTILRWIVESS